MPAPLRPRCVLALQVCVAACPFEQKPDQNGVCQPCTELNECLELSVTGTFSLSENTAPKTIVGTAKAVDLALESDAPYTYSLDAAATNRSQLLDALPEAAWSAADVRVSKTNYYLREAPVATFDGSFGASRAISLGATFSIAVVVRQEAESGG